MLQMVNVQGRYGTITYKPYHDDNGDYIERTSYVDLYYDWEFDVSYTLYQRDGTEMSFTRNDNDLAGTYNTSGGVVGWKVAIGISSMSDRFGNTLNYNWTYEDDEPIAVTNISNGNAQIAFTLDGSKYYTKAELKVGSEVFRTVEYGLEDPNSPVYVVTKKGKGVDSAGAFNGTVDKEYETKYLYDSGENLIGISHYGDLENKPSLAVWYDNYGRVDGRRDYIDPDQYLETYFEYSYNAYDHLQTTMSATHRAVIQTQNADGALLTKQTLTSDGSTTIDPNSLYEDSDNPLKPTTVREYFDDTVRKSWNDYNDYGDLTEQRIYLNTTDYIATEIEYHPDYSFETSLTRWQDINKTGEKVQKLSVYGDADGTVDEYGEYLVQEKVLLYDGDPNDPNDNTWAVTHYEYYDTGSKKGLVKAVYCSGLKISDFSIKIPFWSDK